MRNNKWFGLVHKGFYIGRFEAYWVTGTFPGWFHREFTFCGCHMVGFARIGFSWLGKECNDAFNETPENFES